jgi:hypothetical protein
LEYKQYNLKENSNMSKGIESLVESRLAAMAADRNRLTQAWGPHINSVESYFAKQGKTITENDKRNIARCLENALLEGGIKSRSSIFETTDSSAISFLGIQLPVIAALLPSLVLNKLAVTQALDRRSGAVFYLDVKYGTAKGSIAGTESMMAATTGHNTTLGGREYASVRVTNESISGSSGQLTYRPVVLGSVVITNGTETLTDAVTPGVLVSSRSAGYTGTVDTSGNWVLTQGAMSGTVVASYKYDWQTGGSGGVTTANVPEVNIAVTAATITAEDFPLKALFTLGAAIDLEKAHGLNLEDELVKYLGGEVKFTMDHLGIDMMNAASQGTGCATSPGTYTAAPSTGEAWVDKYMPTIKMFNSVELLGFIRVNYN